VEGVAFRVAEELFSVEPSLAHDARKARDFAKGEYSDDVDGLERRGLNRRWLDSAQSLADRIYKRLAHDGAHAIVLDDGEAEAAYAVLSVTTSVDYSTDHGRADLWGALGRYLGNPLGLEHPG